MEGKGRRERREEGEGRREEGEGRRERSKGVCSQTKHSTFVYSLCTYMAHSFSKIVSCVYNIHVSF